MADENEMKEMLQRIEKLEAFSRDHRCISVADNATATAQRIKELEGKLSCSHAWGEVFKRKHDLGHYIHLIQCRKCGEVHVDLNTGTNKERDWVCIIPGRRGTQ